MKTPTIRVLAASAGVALLFTLGCGKKPRSDAPEATADVPAPSASAPGTAAGSVPAGLGKITGKVIFSGTPPTPEAIRMDADPFCKSHGGAGVSETIVVGADGALKNALIFLKDGTKGKPFTRPKTKVLLDQVGCQYVPHVAGVMVGQKIEIRNSDETLHNVHASPTVNPSFNIGQPMKGMTAEKTFNAPEVVVRFKCDVHPWMAAYLGVFDHPWFAVSGPDGTFTIADVPAGTYTVEAWHEALPVQTAQVTVAGGETPANFTFQK